MPEQYFTARELHVIRTALSFAAAVNDIPALRPMWQETMKGSAITALNGHVSSGEIKATLAKVRNIHDATGMFKRPKR